MRIDKISIEGYRKFIVCLYSMKIKSSLGNEADGRT